MNEIKRVMRAAAAEMLAAAREIMASDRKAMEEAIWTALDDQIARLKFTIDVTFDYGWVGQHYRQTETSPEEWPEFETSDEKATIHPRTNVILFSKIKEIALQELLKVEGRLDDSPEALVLSREFVDALRTVIKSDDFGYLEDVDVELEGGHKTYSRMDLKLTLVGSAVRVDASLSDRDLEKIMETVREHGDDWYKPEYDPPDRDDD